MHTIHIRLEQESDYRKTEEIARDAFWNLYFPGAHEHYVVHKLRQHHDFIPELSFVIEIDGKVEGAIFYSHSKIITEKGMIPTISFGPVFLSPRYHRQGFGRKLITHSIEKAKEMDYSAILTLGYPYHYEPYGFVGGKKYGISLEDGQYYMGLLALPLQEHALDKAKGYVQFCEALNVTDQEVEQFDLTFPPKEKCVLPCQKEFEIACATLDTKEYT